MNPANPVQERLPDEEERECIAEIGVEKLLRLSDQKAPEVFERAVQHLPS